MARSTKDYPTRRKRRQQRAEEAAEQLLRDAGIEPEDLDAAYEDGALYEENGAYGDDDSVYDDEASYEDGGSYGDDGGVYDDEASYEDDGSYEDEDFYEDGGSYDEDAFYEDEPYEDEAYDDASYEEEADAPKEKKGWRRHLFLWCMLAYAFVAVVISLILYRKLWNYIADYEESLPKYGMAPVMEALAPEGEGIRSLLSPETLVRENRFADYDSYVELLEERLAGRECSYEEAAGASAEHPRYVVYAEGEPVMEVSLQVIGQNGHQMSLWGPEAYYADRYLVSEEEYTVVVPAGAVVTVNGIDLTEDDLVRAEDGTPLKTEIEDLELVAQYLEEVPYFLTYHVSGLLGEPQIAAAAADGTALALTREGERYTAALPTDEAAVAEITERIDAIMESYGKHFIGKDAAGIYQYLLPDSDYRSSVRSVDVSWFPTSHITSYSFENPTAEDFITYTEDCVSCKIGFDLMVYFDSEAYKTQNRGADATWIFLKREDTWYLAQVLRQSDRDYEGE